MRFLILCLLTSGVAAAPIADGTEAASSTSPDTLESGTGEVKQQQVDDWEATGLIASPLGEPTCIGHITEDHKFEEEYKKLNQLRDDTKYEADCSLNVEVKSEAGTHLAVVRITFIKVTTVQVLPEESRIIEPDGEFDQKILETSSIVTRAGKSEILRDKLMTTIEVFDSAKQLLESHTASVVDSLMNQHLVLIKDLANLLNKEEVKEKREIEVEGGDKTEEEHKDEDELEGGVEVTEKEKEGEEESEKREGKEETNEEDRKEVKVDEDETKGGEEKGK